MRFRQVGFEKDRLPKGSDSLIQSAECNEDIA